MKLVGDRLIFYKQNGKASIKKTDSLYIPEDEYAIDLRSLKINRTGKERMMSYGPMDF